MSPGCEAAGVAEVDFAVDLGRVGLGAAGGADAVMVLGMRGVEVALVGEVERRKFVDAVDEHVDGRADLGGEFLGADPRGEGHDRFVALLLDVLGDRIGQGIGGRALDRLELECSDAVELRFFEPGRADTGSLPRSRRGSRRRSSSGWRGPVLARAMTGCAAAPWRRWRAGASRAAPWGSRAGTGCRGRGGPDPRPSAG